MLITKLLARRVAGALVVVATFFPAGSFAGSAPDDPVARLQALQPKSARTRVMVLATFHIRTIEKSFRPEMLDGVVEALARFKPDAIAIENLSGSRVLELEIQRGPNPLYAEVLDGFARTHLALGKAALDFLKTTSPAATAKVRELLAARRARGGAPSAGARANLALWMAAAHDPASAALQWSYLTPGDRAARKAIPPGLADLLDSELAKVNEVPVLAIRLARLLGLDKLDAVDDFEDLDAYPEFLPRLEKDIKDNPLLEASRRARVYEEAAVSLQKGLKANDLFPHYLLLNSPGYADADVAAQWGVYLKTRFPGGSDRSRLGLWENRNLKIAARVRAVAALHPGGRVLVIYGAAHKPFLTAYLERTADVECVPFPEP
ncbi:MAG: DUF5694 domain-containing protein [Acidobacteriota bacterium]|nr:DUF5694 domain-containing protein [Acidobacteriota bacterium]